MRYWSRLSSLIKFVPSTSNGLPARSWATLRASCGKPAKLLLPRERYWVFFSICAFKDFPLFGAWSNNRKKRSVYDSELAFVVAKICCSGCREIPPVHYLHFMPLLNIPKGKQTRLVRRQTTIKRFDEPRIHGRCLLWIIIDSLRVSFHFQWKHYYEIRRLLPSEKSCNFHWKRFGNLARAQQWAFGKSLERLRPTDSINYGKVVEDSWIFRIPGIPC